MSVHVFVHYLIKGTNLNPHFSETFVGLQEFRMNDMLFGNQGQMFSLLEMQEGGAFHAL